MIPWQAFGTPTDAMRRWAAQQAKQCRVNTLHYASRLTASATAGGPRYSGGDPYAWTQTRYGNLSVNLKRAYYARLSRNRRKAHQRGG